MSAPVQERKEVLNNAQAVPPKKQSNLHEGRHYEALKAEGVVLVGQLKEIAEALKISKEAEIAHKIAHDQAAFHSQKEKEAFESATKAKHESDAAQQRGALAQREANTLRQEVTVLKTEVIDLREQSAADRQASQAAKNRANVATQNAAKTGVDLAKSLQEAVNLGGKENKMQEKAPLTLQEKAARLVKLREEQAKRAADAAKNPVVAQKNLASSNKS